MTSNDFRYRSRFSQKSFVLGRIGTYHYVVGCGNSSLSGDLERVGWRNVTNIDISTVVLRNMKNQDKTAQTYLAMDMTNMPFRDQSFDIVIEKAGVDHHFLPFELGFQVPLHYIHTGLWILIRIHFPS